MAASLFDRKFLCRNRIVCGSTLLTPLYVIYRQKFGFSGVTLTLIYAAYVVGNLGALLLFGRVSDQVGRRRAA